MLHFVTYLTTVLKNVEQAVLKHLETTYPILLVMIQQIFHSQSAPVGCPPQYTSTTVRSVSDFISRGQARVKNEDDALYVHYSVQQFVRCMLATHQQIG